MLSYIVPCSFVCFPICNFGPHLRTLALPCSDVLYFIQCPARHDERSVCQLCGAEDDRRIRATTAQGIDAQDPTTPQLAAQIYVWEAHHCQT